MICAKNIHRTTKYFLLILLIHCHLCFAQDDAENNRTTFSTLEPFDSWNRIPTLEPSGISEKHPYLYFSSILFVVIIIATSFLIGLRSCYKTLSYLTFQCSSAAPVTSQLRPSLILTEAVLINRRVLPYDKPPSYSSVVPEPSYRENNILLASETPPPNYSSII